MMTLSTLMKAAGAAAIATVLTAPAWAQGPGGGMMGPGGGPGGGMMGPGGGPGGGMMGPGGGRGAMMIEMYDADGDGRVTREEFLAGHAVRFEEMDVNKDGSVTFEEFTVTFKGRNPERARAAFQRLDANGSGAIDKGEYDAVAEIRFERIDINSDGVITREEIIAAMPMRGGGMPAQPMAPKPQ